MQVEVASGPSLVVYELPPSSVRWDTDGTYIYQLVDAEPGAQRPYRAKVQRIDLVDETADTALFTAALDETGSRNNWVIQAQRGCLGSTWRQGKLGMVGFQDRPRWNDIFVKRPVIAVVVSLLLLLAGFVLPLTSRWFSFRLLKAHRFKSSRPTLAHRRIGSRLCYRAH